jgi:hypothetical protein
VFGFRFPGYSENLIHTPFYAYDPVSQTLSAVLFAGLCLYVWFGSLKKTKEMS